jgi:hypothetical protein
MNAVRVAQKNITNLILFFCENCVLVVFWFLVQSVRSKPVPVVCILYHMGLQSALLLLITYQLVWFSLLNKLRGAFVRLVALKKKSMIMRKSRSSLSWKEHCTSIINSCMCWIHWNKVKMGLGLAIGQQAQFWDRSLVYF